MGERGEMINYLKNIFTSDYDHDPAFVRLIRIVLSASTVLAVPIAIAMMFANHPASSVTIVFMVALLSAVSLFLSYRNILWFGKAVFPLIVLVAVTFIALNTYGLHDSSIAGFALVIVFASLFIGQKAIPLATFFTLLGVWVVAYADMTGINKSLIAEKTSWDAVAAVTIFQIVAAASLNQLMSRLNSVLGNVRRSEQDLLENNRELNDIRSSLEEKVIERTSVAEAARADSESSRRDLEVQFWLANGQTQLADVMRGDMNVHQLAENVISQLCQYTGTHAGALYLLKQKTLTLEGRYAFGERPGFEDGFKLGEGVVGQAAADGKVIYLDEIPSDSVTISTGLVDVKPRQMAAAPFHANGEVVGVLELATLSEFTQNHLELWQRTSESIGVAFRTAQTRQRLSELLMESQQQSEELQAQEEELRAANEELHAQAENLKASQSARLNATKGISNG